MVVYFHRGGRRGYLLMLKDIRPVQESDIQGLVDRLAEVLCLHHWRIKYKIETSTKMGKSLMQVMPNRDRQLATIFIREDLVGLPSNEFAPLLFHELMHLVLDPLAEEHTFQLQYEVSAQRLGEYQQRFKRPLEKVVEHLTSNIAPLIALAPIKELQEIAESSQKQLQENTQVVESISEQVKELLRRDNECIQLINQSNADKLDVIIELLKSTKPA